MGIMCMLVMIAAVQDAWAQASLASEDLIDEVTVTVQGVKETFTVVRDARNREQFYYAPDRPRLSESTVGGQSRPDFTLIRYQFKDPKNPQELLEGGLLQFAASLALAPEAIPQLKAAISKTFKVPEAKVRLAALPFKHSKVTLYTPKSGDIIASETQGPGIAPTFSTQKMAFSVPLTKIGSDIFDELVNGNTGLAMTVEFAYEGLTPPGGFKVIVDWKQAHKFYSKDEKIRAKASYYGLVSANASVDRSKLFEELKESKAIEVEITEGSGFKAADAEKYLQPILNRINEELLVDLKPPDKIDPAKTAPPSQGGFFAGGGYSVAIKNEKRIKQGKETINFNVRQHMERQTVASGFIGIGRYPEKLRKEMVTIVPEGQWKSAFFVLPSVGDSEEIGINQVDLQISLLRDNQTHESQVVMWTPKDGWKDRNGLARTVVAFPLMSVMRNNLNMKDVKFQSKANITLKREVLQLMQVQDAFNGDVAIATPFATVDVVTVDGSDLIWKKLDPTSKLSFVNVRLQSGEKSFTQTIKPRNIDGAWQVPTPLRWLVKKKEPGAQDVPITAKIQFELADGNLVDWKNNGKDLQQDLATLDINLKDSDWQN